MFNETSTTLGISLFKNVKCIEKLKIFPFEFHPHQKKIIKYILKYNKTCVNLINQYHIQYGSNAFYRTDENYVKISINNRIIIDISYFRKINPNYARSVINELARSDSLNSYHYFPNKNPDRIKNNSFNSISLNEDDLMICCQIIYGWNFGNK
jgi:hypothetical protein